MPTPSPAALPVDPGAYGPDGRSAWMDVDWSAHRRFVEVDGRWVNVVEIGPGASGAGTASGARGAGDTTGAPAGGAIGPRRAGAAIGALSAGAALGARSAGAASAARVASGDRSAAASPGAPAFVFVHGLAGSWHNWLENLPHFAAGDRVITFDLPGFGASEMPGEKISIPGYARFVERLLDQLEAGAVVVAGNSMGGFIGAELAIQFPARVERLVLVSAAGLTVEYQRRERVLGLLRFGSNALMAWGGWVDSRSDALAKRPRARRLLMGFVVHRPDLLPAPLVCEQVRGSGAPGFVDALDAVTDYPIRDRLGRIGCPTLIVWGENDHLIPPATPMSSRA